MNKILAVLVLFTSVSIPEVTSTKLKELQKNCFHQVHVHTQDTVNKMFRLLHLNRNFTRSYKNHLLLSMHKSLKTIAEEIDQEFKTVQKIAKLKGRKNPKEGHFNLEKIIQMVIEDMLKPTASKAPNNQSKITGVNLTLTSIEIPDKSEESINFIREYLYNVKGSELYGFESPTQKIKQFYEHYKLKAKKDIKSWQAPNSTEDFNGTLTRRIFNGKNVKVKKYPFIASVHVMGDFNCAASIITKEWALTAAVCLHIAYKNKHFVRKHPDAISIRIGSDYTERLGQVCAISRIVFHPEYNPETLQNNLAMVKFWYKIHFRKKNKKIRKIAYRSLFRRMPPNVQKILLLGWGSKDLQVSSGYDPLSSTRLDIYDIERCKKIYSSKYVTDTNFCAGFQSKGSGACQRDAGGPGIVNSVLIGVVSFGPPICGTADAPTVFTNIDLYTKWIDSVLQGKHLVRTSKAPVPITITTMAKVEKPKKKLKRQKKRYKTDLRIPRAQYPKAIRVVTEILNNLIAGRDLDSIAYEDSNEESDDSEGVLIDFAEENEPKDRAELGNLPLKNPQKLDQLSLKQPDKLQQLVNSDKNNNTNLKPLLGNNDPYFLAIKNLQGNLGLNRFMNTVTVIGQPANGSNNIKSTTTISLNMFKPTTEMYLGPYASAESWNKYVAKDLISNQKTSPDELDLLPSSETSDSDNYESESETGISIEVPPGTVTELAVESKETTRLLSQSPTTPALIETIFEQKNEQFLKSLSYQPKAEKSNELLDLLLPEDMTNTQSLQINKNQRQKKRFHTQSAKWMTILPNFKSKRSTKRWLQAHTGLYLKSRAERSNSMSREKANITSSDIKSTNEVTDNDDDEIPITKKKKTNKTETKKPRVGDASEIVENTNELHILAEQIKTELLLESSEQNSTGNISTNVINDLESFEMSSEEQSNADHNYTGNKSREVSNVDLNIHSKEKLTTNEQPLKKLKIDIEGMDKDSSEAESNFNRVTQLHYEVEADEKVHAERKSIKTADNLSQVEKEELDRQLLDYINV